MHKIIYFSKLLRRFERLKEPFDMLLRRHYSVHDIMRSLPQRTQKHWFRFFAMCKKDYELINCWISAMACVHIYTKQQALSHLLDWNRKRVLYYPTLGCSVCKTDIGEYALTAWRSFSRQSRSKYTYSFDVTYYNNSELLLSKTNQHRNEIVFYAVLFS